MEINNIENGQITEKNQWNQNLENIKKKFKTSSSTDHTKKVKTITNIRYERGVIIKDPTNIERIIRKYYKQLYVNKSDNADEVEKLLERYKVSKLTQ